MEEFCHTFLFGVYIYKLTEDRLKLIFIHMLYKKDLHLFLYMLYFMQVTHQLFFFSPQPLLM